MAEGKREKTGKILVTGSSGMLGIDLCQELAGAYDVIGLDCKPRNTLHASRFTLHASRFTNIQCDIRDRDKTIESIDAVKPDIVIHAAAWPDVDGCELNPDKAFKVNRDGTENVAFACEKLNILLIYISTDFVFDGRKNLPYNEKDLPNPLSIYGKSKFEGEKKVAALGKYIIVRTSWLFGKNGKNFVESILNMAKKKKKIEVVDDQKGCPTYTKDLAKAIHMLLNTVHGTRYTAHDIFHISNTGPVTWFDYAREIVRLAGIDAEVIPIKSSELKRPAPRPSNSALDTGKFEAFTGYNMRNWRDALKEYFSYERK